LRSPHKENPGEKLLFEEGRDPLGIFLIDQIANRPRFAMSTLDAD